MLIWYLRTLNSVWCHSTFLGVLVPKLGGDNYGEEGFLNSIITYNYFFLALHNLQLDIRKNT